MATTLERQPTPYAAEPSPYQGSRMPQVEAVLGNTTIAERTYLGIVREWGRSIESGDDFMRGHGARVAEHAVALAAVLGVDRETRMAVYAGAHLHGVGRLRVPRAIQHKSGVLTPQERAAMQQIPLWGADILSKVALPWNVAPVVRWCNERVNGNGYPDRLSGASVPVAAQAVGIANVFDALISPRSYRPAFAPVRAVRELARFRTWWSDDVFGTYLTQLQSRYSGSLCLA